MSGSTPPRWWRLATAATAFAIAGTGAVALAAPAQAAPTNCTTATFLFGGQSLCTKGPGWHRVVLTCWGFPIEHTVYGPWAIANTASLAFCPNGGALGAGYQTMG